MQHAQARRTNSPLRDRINGCSAKMDSTTDLFNELPVRARARMAVYAAMEPRVSPSEVISNAFRMNRPKSRCNAAARRSMKKACFSSEMLQSSWSLRIFFWRTASFVLDLLFIVINKTRDSVENARASKAHFSPYDAATPSLIPDDNVVSRSAMAFSVSEAKSRCSRVMGGEGAL